MKTLYISISAIAKQSVSESTKVLVGFLQSRGVNIRGVLPGKIKFQPSSIMKSDIEELIKDTEIEYSKITNVKSYPTTKLSDNGKDQEYYLEGIFDTKKVLIVINISSGVITLTED